jgi:hypothetical protein
LGHRGQGWVNGNWLGAPGCPRNAPVKAPKGCSLRVLRVIGAFKGRVLGLRAGDKNEAIRPFFPRGHEVEYEPVRRQLGWPSHGRGGDCRADSPRPPWPTSRIFPTCSDA